MANHQIHKLLSRELTALVGVDDLWCAKPRKRSCQRLHFVQTLQRDCRTVRQDSTAVNIDHRRQVNKALSYADIGGVQCPDLIAAVDDQLAHQVGKHLVLRVALAGAGLRGNSRDNHLSHQGANMQAAYLEPSALELPAQLSGPHEGVVQVQLVHGVHHRQIQLAHWFVQVVHRPSADVGQLGLATDAQFVITVNHFSALSNPALVSAPSKKSISKACCPIFACNGPKSTGLEALPAVPNTSETRSSNCFFHSVICAGCNSYCWQRSAKVLSSCSAAKTTLALNSALKTRRVRRPDDFLLVMVSCQGSVSPAQNPNHALISLFSFAEPLLVAPND